MVRVPLLPPRASLQPVRSGGPVSSCSSTSSSAIGRRYQRGFAASSGIRRAGFVRRGHGSRARNRSDSRVRLDTVGTRRTSGSQWPGRGPSSPLIQTKPIEATFPEPFVRDQPCNTSAGLADGILVVPKGRPTGPSLPRALRSTERQSWRGRPLKASLHKASTLDPNAIRHEKQQSKIGASSYVS